MYPLYSLSYSYNLTLDLMHDETINKKLKIMKRT